MIYGDFDQWKLRNTALTVTLYSISLLQFEWFQPGMEQGNKRN